MTRSMAEGVLATINEEKIWQRLTRSRNDRIVLDTMKYLTDRRDGKPVQAFNAQLSGGLNVTERVTQMLKDARKRLGESEH